LPGKIEKIPCAPYSYQVPGSIDTITLNYTYQYVGKMAKPSLQNGLRKMVPEVEVE
jgi:hypothetical protein